LYIKSNSDFINEISWPLFQYNFTVRVLIYQSCVNFFLTVLIKKEDICFIDNKFSNNISRKSFFFFIIAPISLLFTYFFPWGEFGQEQTFGHSIASFLKTFTIVAFLFFYKINANLFLKLISLLLLSAITYFDGSRTFLFLIVFALLYVYKLKLKHLFIYFPILLLCFYIFIKFTLNRNGIEFDYSKIFWVFGVEAVFSSYSTYSTLYIIDNMSFIQVVNNLLISFPSILNLNFVINLPLLKELVFDPVNYLGNKMSPMGGHLYFAEFVYYFNVLGLFVYSYYLKLFFKIIKNINFKYLPLFAISSFMLVKSPVIVIIKFLILSSIFLYIVYILSNITWKKERL
jgi:hypothetical protein